jgi:hypothetical protein
VGRRGDSIADEIKPLDIQHWLKRLHADQGLLDDGIEVSWRYAPDLSIGALVLCNPTLFCVGYALFCPEVDAAP